MGFLRRLAHAHQAAQPRLQHHVVQRMGQNILGPCIQRGKAQGCIVVGGKDQHSGAGCILDQSGIWKQCNPVHARACFMPVVRANRGRALPDPAAQIKTVAIW